MYNLQEMIGQANELGYERDNATAKVCQDIILKAIAIGPLSRNVTIKGGVVMRSKTQNVRRATQDLDIDFIKYSLADDSIDAFIKKLNCIEGIIIERIGKIEELRQQDYSGKRVNIIIKDCDGNQVRSKIDLGVHNRFELEQEEYCFDIAYSEESVSLLISSDEQMFAEKLRSLLKFGMFSTRFKDIYDMYYLKDRIDKAKLSMALKLYIFNDFDMRENDEKDIVKRLKFVFGDERYVRALDKSDKRWIDEEIEIITKGIVDFVETLDYNKIQLPNRIMQIVKNCSYTIDDIGMSGNQVLIFEDMVLKIEDDVEAATAQVELLQWLDGKLPVPKVIAHEVADGKSYFLMSKVDGVMSCDECYLENPHVLLEALASGLKQLWNVDISECPQRRSLDVVLAEARKRVENHLVDVDNVEPETFGENGFKNPEVLLEWLETHQPEPEAGFSHGDFCLPNVFLKDDKVAGFIDMGRAGVADKWCDIALCYRSLKHNFDGTYGGKVYEDFDPDLLFEKLGLEPNWEKLKYYILLDELF